MTTTSIEVRSISAREHWDAMSTMFNAHWQETEAKVSPTPPQPIVQVYRDMEDAGMLLTFGAFAGEELVGYAMMFVLPHLHYGWEYANHDVLFLRKDHRGEGRKLVDAMRAAAKDLGVQLLWHAKPGSALDVMLSRRGLAVEEIIYREEP